MFSFTSGPFSVRCETKLQPASFHLSVWSTDSGAVNLDLKGPLDPAPRSGFMPGVALALETGVLFFGAGSKVWGFQLPTGKPLWQEDVPKGFLAWARHADVIVMSGELELAAWNLRGHKLWSTHVEPPWKYAVDGETVTLDVQGKPYEFALRRGP